jgi:hypothetical protein
MPKRTSAERRHPPTRMTKGRASASKQGELQADAVVEELRTVAARRRGEGLQSGGFAMPKTTRTKTSAAGRAKSNGPPLRGQRPSHAAGADATVQPAFRSATGETPTELHPRPVGVSAGRRRTMAHRHRESRESSMTVTAMNTPTIPRVRPATGTLRGRRFAMPAGPGLAGTPAGPLAPAASGAIASAARVEEIIRTTLGSKITSAAVVRMGDVQYYLPTLNEVQQLLSESSLDRRRWLAERFDCDDFSYVLKGEFSIHAYDSGDISYGFSDGIIWGTFSWVQGFHAVNLVVTNDQTLRLIEPQTDTIYEADQCQGSVGLIVV